MKLMKYYILDTSVLIDDPYAYKNFHNSEIIIPITVLQELDKLKKQSDQAGRNARVAIRVLDELSTLGDIHKGIKIESNKVTLSITSIYYHEGNYTDLNGLGDPTYGDTQILAYANTLNKNSKISSPSNVKHKQEIILVSNDINLRIRARALGITSIAYEHNKYSLNDLYSGIQVIVNEELGYKLQQQTYLNPEEISCSLHPQECILFQDEENHGLAMGRKISSNKIKLLKKYSPWNLSAKNKEQAFAIDLIMDRNVDLITLNGKSGTGKTIIALAAALELVLNRKEYDRLVIYRPIQPVGNDLGYTPGTIEEKLAPWFQAIMDNLEVLFTTKSGGDWRKNLEMYQKKGAIEMEAITYIRGRSIPNSIILIDEVQNISVQEIKTILTRAGENSKIILTGDIEQIDTHFLDATNNGLTNVIEKFKDDEFTGHISFIQGERSRLATRASEIL